MLTISLKLIFNKSKPSRSNDQYSRNCQEEVQTFTKPIKQYCHVTSLLGHEPMKDRHPYPCINRKMRIFSLIYRESNI